MRSTHPDTVEFFVSCHGTWLSQHRIYPVTVTLSTYRLVMVPSASSVKHMDLDKAGPLVLGLYIPSLPPPLSLVARAGLLSSNLHGWRGIVLQCYPYFAISLRTSTSALGMLSCG